MNCFYKWITYQFTASHMKPNSSNLVISEYPFFWTSNKANVYTVNPHSTIEFWFSWLFIHYPHFPWYCLHNSRMHFYKDPECSFTKIWNALYQDFKCILQRSRMHFYKDPEWTSPQDPECIFIMFQNTFLPRSRMPFYLDPDPLYPVVCCMAASCR